MTLTLKTKKRLTTVTQSIFFLFGGIEYAVVLPTLNAYLGQLDGDSMFFGIVMAAFSFSGVLVSPVYGLIQDRVQKTKALILFANLWEIGGNFLYFVGGSKYMLLGSRLISGVGAGVGSAIFAQISKTSTEKDRAGALSVASGARQIGLLFGPAINLPLSYCDFYIGSFHVNSFTAPGIVMCILFICLEVLTLFCFYDIPPLAQQTEAGEGGSVQVGDGRDEKEDVNGSDKDYQEQNGSRDDRRLYDSHTTVENNTSHRLTGGRALVNDTQSLEGVFSPGGSAEVATVSKLNVFLKEEVVVLLTAQFVFMFNQTCLETSLTVMTKQLMDFDGVANSVLYAVAGFELLVSFVIIKYISKFISDRTMLLSSVTLEILPYILLLIFYPHAIPGRARNLWWFSSLFIIQVAGLGFLFISLMSLYSKVTPFGMQGFAHGIRRAVGGIGTIMGPLWAGSMEHWPFETLAVMMALFVLVWGMTAVSWKRLWPHSDVTAHSGETPPHGDGIDETKPLLINADERDYGVA